MKSHLNPFRLIVAGTGAGGTLGADLTLRLGVDPQRCRALSRSIRVVGHHPEAVLGPWHEVLNGDLHFSRTTCVDGPLPTYGQRNNHELRADRFFLSYSCLFSCQ